MAREEAQGVQATTSGFEMRATCLSIAYLGAFQHGRDALQVGCTGFGIKRQRRDQGVGGIADLAQRDGYIFPPVALRFAGPRTDDSPS
jgi:hypothetical protein